MYSLMSRESADAYGSISSSAISGTVAFYIDDYILMFAICWSSSSKDESFILLIYVLQLNIPAAWPLPYLLAEIGQFLCRFVEVGLPHI
jgi:hypothetical protein